ncbi:hypothetical protein BWK63_06265 [Flavobacterium covae]|uniref:Head GIN domain-containing protein n=1 Tax=Flavobacterium covae TaxID=2906076 RepID=A0ABW8PHY9_9FLAO|nr:MULTISPECIES: head GIN domain-containing protein [Flavobacterium]OWP81364.1 hypothetical protein BWK63_06265 [Flavobacterium covae]POR22723.1 hypothetical protein BWK57_05095 [Flavobacterium columnare]
MNKVILLIVSFLVSVNLYGQLTKQVDTFSKVVANDAITVFLIPSNEQKVEISGFQAEKVQLKVENKVLYLHFPESNPVEGNDILAKVYFIQLNALEANDGCNIGASGLITTPNFDIVAMESSKVKLNIKADKVNARISQGSKLDLIGSTLSLDVVANNASKINANSCMVQEAVVNANAGGEIYVNASQSVDARVRAGGSIFIEGNPKKITKQTLLGGDIIVK